MAAYEFKYYQDAGHGWVAVKRKLLEELDVAIRISGFSYQSKSGSTVYLEEDCDLPYFHEAYAKRFGYYPTYIEKYVGNRAAIRSYPRYEEPL